MKARLFDERGEVTFNPEDVEEIMRNYISATPHLSSNEPLFKNAWGNKMTLQNIDKNLKKLIKKCGLKEYTLKDFRNRAILEMAKGGASIESLSNYTGLKTLRLESFFHNVGLIKNCPANLVNYRLIV